jgi:phospholipid/cholesterol/gamma-HCH transport system permease protein
MKSPLNYILSKNDFLYEMILFFGGAWTLFIDSLKGLRRRPYYHDLVIQQIYSVGLKSSSLIFITAASTGMVMALQFGLGLEKFGGKLYIPKIVTVSIVKELGPIFAALMMAARVGAGIASEIGSMAVTQQIDAIRALGTSPIKKIVIPRMLGVIISLPLLTIMANLIGVFGSLIVGATELGLDPLFYFQKIAGSVAGWDYVTGLLKSVVFAFMIGLPACYFGLNVRGGTRGVGLATTRAVVTASILIMISDFVLTKAFWLVEKWTS